MTELLIDVLRELVHGGKVYHEMSNGLRMQFKADVFEFGRTRLLCYRVQHDPTLREITDVRRTLELLLPSGTEIRLDPLFHYWATDSKARHCRVFSWRQDQAIQASLFGMETNHE